MCGLGGKRRSANLLPTSLESRPDMILCVWFMQRAVETEYTGCWKAQAIWEVRALGEDGVLGVGASALAYL